MLLWDGVFMVNAFKVLICDDSLIIRKKLGESIRQSYSNAEIFDAKDGLEALYMYRVHSPNLVFMDIIMPGKNGIEVVKDIKEINPNAEIIMVSASGTKENLLKAFKAGANDFIQKPWEQSVIDRIILRFMPKPEAPPIQKDEPNTERVDGFEITPFRWKETGTEGE